MAKSIHDVARQRTRIQTRILLLMDEESRTNGVKTQRYNQLRKRGWMTNAIAAQYDCNMRELFPYYHQEPPHVCIDFDDNPDRHKKVERDIYARWTADDLKNIDFYTQFFN